MKGSKSRNTVLGLVREFRSLKTHMGNLLGLKGVVGSPVVQVMTQTPNNQSETFQIAHKLIHTSSLLNRNTPEMKYQYLSNCTPTTTPPLTQR